MTIDSVVSRTAITLGLVILTAALTWVFLPDGPSLRHYVSTAWIGGALVGAGLGIWLSFKRTVSPPLVMLYAVAQGFFLGAASEAFEQMWPGIVVSAVVGTLAAFVATLAAYKFFNIQVTSRMRKFVDDRRARLLRARPSATSSLAHVRRRHRVQRLRLDSGCVMSVVGLGARHLLPDPRLRHDRAGCGDGCARRASRGEQRSV